MHPLKLVLSMSLVVFIFCFCHKEADKNSYFAFGHFAGECNKNCSTIFKIENNKLYLDEENYFPSDRDLKFSNVQLSNEKYNIASQIEKNFPMYLLNNSKSTYGCPDCADQGAFYLQINNGTMNRKWFIDPWEIPIEINDYFELIRKSLPELIK